MNKNTLLFLTGVFGLVLVCFLLAFYFLNGSPQEPEATSAELPHPSQSSNDEHVDPQVYIDSTIEAVLYLPTENFDGFVKETRTYKGRELEIQQKILKDVLKKLDTLSGVSIPDNINILGMKVWNETLNVNLSREAKNIKINNKKIEKYVVGAIVNSLLDSSKAFTDVQFLVEGERVEKLFGSIDTLNPLMHIN